MLFQLARNWWAFALRGMLAILFGLFVFAYPKAALHSFVVLFAVCAVAGGIFAIMAAVRSAMAGERWGLFAFEGVLGPVVAVAALAWPRLTVFAFVTLVGFWAMATGVVVLMFARNADSDHGRLWLALGGVASLLYGALMMVSPRTGALVLTWWIGGYAVIFGAGLLALAFRWRARHAERAARAARGWQ